MMGPLSDLKPTFILSKGGSDRPAAILVFHSCETNEPGIFARNEFSSISIV